MPTLFSRLPGGSRLGGSSKNDSSLSSSSHWAGISSTDFPRLDSPVSDDARPLPPINSLPPPPPERSLSMGYPSKPQQQQFHQQNGNSTFLSPQKSIDLQGAASQRSGSWQASTINLGPQTSTHHLLLPPQNLGMSHAASAASTTRLHALLAAEAAEPSQAIQYGYTPTPEGVADVQLELHSAERIVQICGSEIKARGIDVPLIFSSMALDLSASNVKSLISNLLGPEFYHSQASSTTADQINFAQAFLDEVRFANPHDIAALIKWSLARLGRVFEVPVPVQGRGKVQEDIIFMQQRGFLDFEIYMAWRDEERRAHYPLNSFEHFLRNISAPAASLLDSLFSLLSSVTAYSLKNGMTTSKVSRLFGVLLFGLPEDETFARTYDAFARASNATEHLFLAYIRSLSTSSSLPTRLTESVKGYPSMIVSELTAPGKQARGVPLTQIERTVRLYSVDLLQSAAEMTIEQDCPEWAACRTEDKRLGSEPQLSEKYRKLINLRGQAIRKKVGVTAAQAGSRPKTQETAGKTALDAVTVESYGSLASKQWGDFLSDGFSSTDSSKLAFDLRESQRKVRAQRPENRQWSDFAQGGFTVNDSGLDNVLNFDDGLKEEMERWPGERAELNERLRQTQKRLPHFPYDTHPRVIASPTMAEGEGEAPPGHGQQYMHPISRMDETFAEVWADYLVGCGWSNRDELTHRNANFVVVQYKSRPIESAVGVQAATERGANNAAGRPLSATDQYYGGTSSGAIGGAVDDRSDAAWFVIEEVVPAQYRAELEAVGRRKGSSKPMLRKLKLFKKLGAVGGNKRDKANTSNGGGFYGGGDDDVFRPGPGGTTRVLKFNDPAGHYNAGDQSYATYSSAPNQTTRRTSEDSLSGPANESAMSGGSRILSSLRGAARSRRVGGRESNATPPPPPPPKDGYDRDNLTTPTPGDFGRTSNWLNPITGTRQRADSLNSADIETRSFRDPEAELSYSTKSSLPWKRNPLLRHQHKKSKDDAWVDIMMTSSSASTSTKATGGGDHYDDLATSRARTGSGDLLQTGTSNRAAGDESEFNDGRLTPTTSRSRADDYDRGTTTPTPTFDRRGSGAGGPVPSATATAIAGLDDGNFPPSSSTPIVSRTAAPLGLGLPVETAAAAAGWTAIPVSPTKGPRTAAGQNLSPVLTDAPEMLTPRMEKDTGVFAVSTSPNKMSPPSPNRLSPSISATAAQPAGSPSQGSPNALSTSTSAATAVGGSGSALLGPPSPSRGIGSLEAAGGSETDLNSRIAQEAAAAAQGRSGTIAPWEVEAQRKRLEQERIQESLRLARSLREKLKTVEARERAGGANGGARDGLGGSTGAGAGSSYGSSSTGSTGETGLSGNGSAEASGPPVPARPTIDPFAKKTPGRVADIASRFGGPRRTASGGSDSRSPLSPLSPQGTGGESGLGSNLSIRAAVPNSGPSSPLRANVGGQGGERDGLDEVEELRRGMGSTRVGVAESEGRSSLDGGNLTDGDSIYPDDAASNYSRETSHTDEDGGRPGGAGSSWNTWKGGKLTGVSGGPGQVVFPGDAGRSEEEDMSTPIPHAFREPYQPGMPLDNVTEESESVISGSNV
ncbi:hypothetical protein OC846_004138 [Tilletia horrida]|uniref:Meiotically up-regulated protein Msb1/Mug8 domain-containing protein n=1 Tax=Tilletia horrida TaxID=155126 RepID=A0AAN6JQP4_9BASI|nr:hypothetical protein OC845_004229 [Tilletia horrida]KAK0549312.1 hypothetical protein OC846_004138 [Tilletia horrida]KAK0564138.1 hypothetical protein OC861_004451 [Tilletia horrida]